MVSSRSDVLPVHPISLLSDQQLQLAIAREVMGWKHILCDKDGRITNTRPAMVTTVPPIAPNWITNESSLGHLESSIVRKVGPVAYRAAMDLIAGDFNQSPTMRQRCEAVLLAARRHRDGI